MKLPKLPQKLIDMLKAVDAKFDKAFSHWYNTALAEFAVDCVRVAFMLGMFYLFLWLLTSTGSTPAAGTGAEAGAEPLTKLNFSFSVEGPHAKTVTLLFYGFFVFCFGQARKLRFTFRDPAEKAETKEAAPQSDADKAVKAEPSVEAAAPTETVENKPASETNPSKN